MPSNAHAQLTKALDLLLDVICIVDADGRFVALSAACEQVFGYKPEELVGKPMIELVLPADRERTLQAATAVMNGQLLRNFENRYLRKDGQVVDIMWSARWSEADRLRLAVAHEITLRKRADSMQAALHAISEAAHSAEDLTDLFRRIHQIIGDLLPTGNFLVALHDSSADGITFPYFVDDQETASDPHQRDSATLAAEVIRTGAAIQLTEETRDSRPKTAQGAAGADPFDRLGVPLIAGHRTIGALVVGSHSATARYGEQHMALLQFVSTQIAATIERKQANARLQYLAQYDMLTGLPNRTLFDDRLQLAIARAARSKGRLALLYIDLDQFKPVNDNFGHATGDLLLRELAARVQACVRGSDTVCRLGGDEFVVLLDSIDSLQNASAVAEKIRAAIHQPFDLPGCRAQVAASIGIAVYPDHALDCLQLARMADTAMYAAKRSGGNQCRRFSD